MWKHEGTPITKNNYFLFWKGWPSQWYPCSFLVGNYTYNCAEQFMMAQKAKLFHDDKAFDAIMGAEHPAVQKSWGRKVKGFDKDKWNAYAREIVYLGNIAKFMQNPKLMKNLINTDNLILVEASPYDKVWGIGLGQHDSNAADKSKWKGKNWLGEVLMRVRDALSYVSDTEEMSEAQTINIK